MILNITKQVTASLGLSPSSSQVGRRGGQEKEEGNTQGPGQGHGHYAYNKMGEREREGTGTGRGRGGARGTGRGTGGWKEDGRMGGELQRGEQRREYTDGDKGRRGHDRNERNKISTYGQTTSTYGESAPPPSTPTPTPTPVITALSFPSLLLAGEPDPSHSSSTAWPPPGFNPVYLSQNQNPRASIRSIGESGSASPPPCTGPAASASAYDVSGVAVIPSPSTTGTSVDGSDAAWPCSVCTFLNDPALPYCELCDAPRS